MHTSPPEVRIYAYGALAAACQFAFQYICSLFLGVLMSVIFSLLPTAAITPAALLTGLLPQGCGAIAAAAVAAWMFGKQQSRAPTAREATQFALWKQCMQLLFSAAVAMLLMGSIQKIVTGIALTLQYSHMYAMYYLVGLVAFVAEFFIARWFFLYFARRQASVAVPAT